MRMINEAFDVKKVIKDMQGDFGGDNASQMKGLQLLKGLATSDDPKANEFMKALNTAMTTISKKVLGDKSDKKESKLKESVDLYQLLSKEYPKAQRMIPKVSEAIEWDIEAAMSFSLSLLEDVNMSIMDLEQFFNKQASSFGESIIIKGNGELLDMDEEYSIKLETGKKYSIQEVN